MFKEFFFLEVKSALKRPMVYIFFFFMALMCFLAVVSDSVVIGGSVGNVFKNSPHIITNYVNLMTLIFGIFFSVAFFNNAALRDYNNQFNEILFSTPLTKMSYFFGRFLGALFLATIPLLGIYLGILLGAAIGPLAGWIEPDRIGLFFLETFINNYFLFMLPNMLFAGTVIFALATKFKSTTISFVGALGLFIAYLISGTLLSDVDNETIAAMLDSFGLRAYRVHSQYFTPIEKNTLSPVFGGLLLWNRLLWIGIGLIILILTYFSFSFKEKKSKRKKKVKKDLSANQIFALPQINPSFSYKLNWQQFRSLLNISFLNIIKSMVFKIIFIFCAIILITEMVGGYEYFGLQSYPLTYIVVDMVTGSTALFVFIILIFFSGELVWSDRSSHIHEVINSSPHSSVISLLAKTSTLIGVASVLYLLFSILGILYQLILGFTNIELDVYLLTFIYDQLPGYLFWSVFFIFIQVITNHKYLGYFISILIFVFWDLMLSLFDVNSNMLSLGSGPGLGYSDLNQFGPGFTGAMWFALYWSLFAGVLFMIAGSFWVRSSSGSIKNRLKLVKSKFNKTYSLKFAIVTVLWISTASFVYYNTQILNPYKTSDEFEQISIKYEKKYKKYENITMPKVKEVVYHIDIYPEERNIKAKADLIVKNESNTPIDSIHYNLDESWETTIDIPNSELVHDDDTLDYKIFKLNSPMMPGDSFKIHIETNYITKGFQNGTGNTSIIKNGTFINNGIIPSMGYNPQVELSDKNDRKKFKLPPKDRMPALFEEDSCTTACMENYLSNGRSDWVKTETFISTSADQVAIAPGSLIKEWSENDRNYYHYKVDHPSQDFCSFVSADYQIAKRDWNGVSLEIYYNQKHAYNIDKMLDALEKSMKYYTKHFGPYYHKQARIIEFPNYSTFAQAFPGTMPYSEAFGFIIDLEDTTKNNVIDAVIAHEMAHQWWAHQEVGATMQGGTMLTESFAEYSSLMVMKQEKDDLAMKEFLKYDFNRYLRGRSSERENELPLYKVENQGHIHYGKGSVILYALQDYIGEDKVNNALRNFLNEFKYKAPPYPTSLDFLKHLEKEVPDSLNYLIEDWFKTITLYDLRLESAEYSKTADGKYKVNFEVKATKLKADSIGNESIEPINDWIDIGLFKDSDEEELLVVKRVKMNKESQRFSLVSDTEPAKAAIDPKRILIERIYKDNFKPVKEKEKE